MYDRQISENETITLGVSGMLYRNGLIMYDHQTESLWSHILGKAVAGDYKDTPLTFIPALQTDWQTWQELHPDTLVVSPRLFGVDSYASYYAAPDAGVIGSSVPRDGDLYTKEYVLGVRLNDENKAYPFSILNDEQVVNDEVGSVPVVIFFDKGTASGTVFDRELSTGERLTFKPGQSARHALDEQTGSTWEILTGTAIQGPLQGTELAQVPITYAFWFGWADYHGEENVYQGKQ